MKVYINYEAFELIEKRGSMTPTELAKAIGIKETSAAVWLSKWTKKGYLKWESTGKRERVGGKGRPGRPLGHYKITNQCRWWGELVYESESVDTEIRQ